MSHLHTGWTAVKNVLICLILECEEKKKDKVSHI